MSSKTKRNAPSKRNAPFNMPEIIWQKRNGNALKEETIQAMIREYTRGTIPDYQMSAFAMATFFQGMTPKETTALTLAMRDSGKVVNLSNIKALKVDKHSTGGVGDKISICLAPMVAACGVPVPMVSGRGLGHTGGTLDKLQAIPGFDINLSTAEFRRMTKKIGCSLIGQTATLAPADKRFYALRDVTATVESVPLITASILSKKLAEGIDGLVLDVKVGRGAFMKNIDEARTLAKSLVRVGKLAGKSVRALLTDMDQPLGYAVGNANETVEAFQILCDDGPDDVRDLTLELGAEMLVIGKAEKSVKAARKRLEGVIADGSAIKKMEEIIAAQKGDPRVVTEHDRMPKAKSRTPIVASRSGYISDIDPLEVGLCSVALGAGRAKTTDEVDSAAGIQLHKRVGDKVKKGEVVAEMLCKSKTRAAKSEERLKKAIRIGTKAPTTKPLFLDRIR